MKTWEKQITGFTAEARAEFIREWEKARQRVKSSGRDLSKILIVPCDYSKSTIKLEKEDIDYV